MKRNTGLNSLNVPVSLDLRVRLFKQPDKGFTHPQENRENELILEKVKENMEKSENFV